MTMFTMDGGGGSGMNRPLFSGVEYQIRPMWFRVDLAEIDLTPIDNTMHGYRTFWWPGGNSFVGNAGDAQLLTDSEFGFEPTEGIATGSSGRFAITGITRDAYGSPLGGCTVKCFLTQTDEIVATGISDANGVYTITTPYYDAHYLVQYKAGTPDVFGSSVNTLIPPS